MERSAAGGVKMIHVGAAVGVDACQQWHQARQIAEVVPVDGDAGGESRRYLRLIVEHQRRGLDHAVLVGDR